MTPTGDRVASPIAEHAGVIHVREITASDATDREIELVAAIRGQHSPNITVDRLREQWQEGIVGAVNSAIRHQAVGARRADAYRFVARSLAHQCGSTSGSRLPDAMPLLPRRAM
jgi:hypothetical protein